MFWYGFNARPGFVVTNLLWRRAVVPIQIVDILRIPDQANQVTCGQTSEMC